MASQNLFAIFRCCLLNQSPVMYSSVRFRLVGKKEKMASKAMKWAQPLREELMLNKSETAAPVEPSMLHMVTRVKTLKGRPQKEKSTMFALNLTGPQDQKVVLKNTPSVNKMLNKVKHLIKITPITFPNGYPEEKDFEYCLLKDNGEFIIRKEIQPIEKNVIPDTVPAEKQRLVMDKKTLERHLLLHLRHYRLNMEYFPAKYVYKYNQDGKEYRYRKNTSSDSNWY
ncbi:uncharacterized protein LOC106883224 [Octopus bimaculoides]|uniref:Large ribosomal subunit protein uL30m n=1 Tax=Octopus bimaculoides TaxID=37653 RepID=A0A0L8FIS1_OCTBM|nr:uncharacterized protein LOC106883224 [Octopus bimaculoides]|eukprot:XP_014789637.1 PREDICTED: uncharacterized protein LOC106883224 [Octopus bimaculoides]